MILKFIMANLRIQIEIIEQIRHILDHFCTTVWFSEVLFSAKNQVLVGGSQPEILGFFQKTEKKCFMTRRQYLFNLLKFFFRLFELLLKFNFDLIHQRKLSQSSRLLANAEGLKISQTRG